MIENRKIYEKPVIRKIESGMPGKFGLAPANKPLKQIEGIDINQLITKYGSPLFVVSENIINKNFEKAKRAFSTRYPKVQFAWSYKTNYLDAVCQIFHKAGSWAEVVSGFEYEKALQNGVDGKKIIFNGPDKSEEDLIKAIGNDSLIHIDHLDELYMLIEIAGKHNLRPRVAIRVNMDTGIYPMWDRFGFNYENGQALDAINKIVHSGVLELTGLHCHIGTFILSAQAYAIAAEKLATLAIAIKQKFQIQVKYIDLGGGFASSNTLKGSYLQGSDANPGFDEYAEAICTSLYNAGFHVNELPLLILETGRALIDEAGYLITSVIANKRLVSGKRSIIVDAGVNIMFTSFWYDHKIVPAQEFTAFQEETMICGPLCMNIDVLRENILLPPLKKGEKLVVQYVGAYNMTQWMQFITMRPAIVLIDSKSQDFCIRTSENLDSVKQYEQVPNYLIH